MNTLQKLIYNLLPSSKLNTDIEIQYNQCGTLKPIQINELSLTTPIKKKILKLREENKRIEVHRDNKKLSLIIPYRNREEHLHQFLPAIKKTLEQQNIDYEIIIVEQDDNYFFNKAKLMNLAALNADKESQYFVFHDVDSMPIDIDYRYCNQTIRLYNYIRREYQFEEYPQTVFGGAILIPKEIFFEINGFANSYWQWGKEDDDFLLRHLLKGYIPFYDTVGKLDMLPHPRALQADNEGNPTTDKKILKQNEQLSNLNKQTFSKLKRGIISQEDDGINNVKDYKINSITTDDKIKTIKIQFKL